MTKRLEKNLYSKHKLSFGANGRFRILMVSDLQETNDMNVRTMSGLNSMLDRASPDLLIFGGDNINGKILRGEDEARRYIDLISKPAETRKIPWAHIYGNHDRDTDVSIDKMQKMYEAHDYCVSKHTGRSVCGKSNFMLPIYGNAGSVKFTLWGLDGNNRWKNFCADYGLPPDTKPRLPNSPEQYNKWDLIRFDQIMWYYNSSLELERHLGYKPEGMLVTHIAPHEFQLAKDNKAECNLVGATEEKMSLSALNCGIFAAVLERGDIKTIACGHTHENDFCAELYGIKLCLDACGGFSPYGVDERRGGRVFTLTETESGVILTTEMIRAEKAEI